jgi:hypothetical protein
MNKDIRTRFWIEVALASLTAGLFVVTLVWGGWIELVFGVEPDGGDGSLEHVIVAVLAVATVVFVWLAHYEWRRVQERET